jgi:hypothetical protein
MVVRIEAAWLRLSMMKPAAGCSKACEDSREFGVKIQAVDGSLCVDGCPMGEDGAALSV